MPERQCKGCTRQAEWGCEAKRWRTPEGDERDGPENWLNPSALPTKVGDDEVYFCPRQGIREDPRVFSRLLMFYQMFKAGYLPDGGAIVDQSNVLIETLRVFDEENANCDQVIADRDRAKKARNARAQGGKGKGKARR